MTDRIKALAAHPSEGIAALTPILLAFALGMFILYGTGIVEASALHNAAHDSRHAFAFPCH